LEYSQFRGFRDNHDSGLFVEPFDFFHVFDGIDFSKLFKERCLDRIQKQDQENKNKIL
tara:strand:+ start:114 stop:287 length:174 start_codon:yes stop_codon:yes gene_type:complete